MLDTGTDHCEPQHRGTSSGLSPFRELGDNTDNTDNTQATSAAVDSGPSMGALGILEPGFSAHNSFWPPVFPQQRPLVPRKRGGRHGRLDDDQLKRQRTARLTGVCIRCKVLNKSVCAFSLYNRRSLTREKVLWRFSLPGLSSFTQAKAFQGSMHEGAVSGHHPSRLLLSK